MIAATLLFFAGAFPSKPDDPWAGSVEAPKVFYRIKTPDGAVYQVDAYDEDTAVAAVRTAYLNAHQGISHESWELDQIVGATVKPSTNNFDQFDPANDVTKPGMFDDLIPGRALGPWLKFRTTAVHAPEVKTQSPAVLLWSILWRVTLFGALPFWLVLRVIDFIFNGPRRRARRAVLTKLV